MVKKSQAIKKNTNQAVRFLKFRFNKLILDSWLIVQGFLGIFVFLALTTFSPRDSGWNTQVFSGDTIDNNQVINAVGSWGAYLSDFLLTIFGYMAYVLVYWLLWPLVSHFFLSRNKTKNPIHIRGRTRYSTNDGHSLAIHISSNCFLVCTTLETSLLNI